MEEWEKYWRNLMKMATTEAEDLWKNVTNSVEEITQDCAETIIEITGNLLELIVVELEDWQEIFNQLQDDEIQERDQKTSGVDGEFTPEETLEQSLINDEDQRDNYGQNDNINLAQESFNSLENLENFEVYHTPKIDPSATFHPACIGCKNYHGHIYGRNILICGMHPYGWDDENCPDFSS